MPYFSRRVNGATAAKEEPKRFRAVWMDDFNNEDTKIIFYTGCVPFGMFLAFFIFLLAPAKQMRTWQGKQTSMDE